jgi:hypothetical protein
MRVGSLILVTWLLVALAAIWQLFGVPPLGIANNGDYSKVSGYYRLGPVVGWCVGESEFYLTDYEFADRFAYRSGLSSSEHFFIWPAVKLSRLLHSKQHFDLRVIAGVKLVWLLGAAAAILTLAARRQRWLVMAGAALWFADASTLCYLPGFYMDTAALLFAASLVAAGGWWLAGVSWAIVPAVGSALGIIMSKSQHAPLALVFAVAALALAVQRRQWAWVVVAGMLGGGGWWVTRETTAAYAAVPVFTLTFYRIGATGDHLGLDARYDDYWGKHAYSEGSPIEDARWRESFLRDMSLGRIAWWYATHPVATAGYLLEDLRRYGGIQPDAGLGWRRAADHPTPRSQTGGVTIWQKLRAWLGPWSVVLALVGTLAHWRTPQRYAFALGAVLLLGCWAIASLADALETARHLYLFQVFADALLIGSLGLTKPYKS